MSHARMEKSAVELENEVKRLLAEAEATDEAEDGRYGKGRRGEKLPEVLRFKQSRLAKSKEAKEAREQAEHQRLEQEKKSWSRRRRERRGMARQVVVASH